MTPNSPSVDDLLDAATDGLDKLVRRMREHLPEDDGDWEFERESFGIDDPKREAELQAKEDAVAREPVVDRPQRPGLPSWRELFRKNWPDKPRRGRR